MMLSDMKCSRIEKNTPALAEDRALELMREIPGWGIKEKTITREFKFKDFLEAMSFVNKVADIANSEDHHPDIFIYYNKVRLDLSTHMIGGLSMNDFIMAAKINLV